MPSTLNSTLQPRHPEHGATHLMEGYVFGLIPGIIENIDDPEGIGRVRVSAPLIHEGSYLPNDRDGWIPVMESWVNNSTPGGSHRFLQPGTQVIMQAIMGDPRQMVVVGCLPSRVDRPHPSLNRAQGTHGSYTPGQVLEVNDDSDTSRVVTRPTGVTEHISGEGTVTVQTRDQARMQLTFDGNALFDNPQAFTLITKEGDVAQQSKDGAQAVLQADGTVKVNSAGQASLILDQALGKMTGPAGSISGMVRAVKDQLSGLGKLGDLFRELNALAERFPAGEELRSVLDKASSKIETALGSFEAGLASLESLSGENLQAMGKALMPQAEKFLVIDPLIQEAQGWLNQKLKIDDLTSRLRDAGVAVSAAQADTLDRLLHVPDQALQYIGDLAADGGFDAVANIFGMGLHEGLGDVRNELDSIIRERDAYWAALLTYEANLASQNEATRLITLSPPIPPDYNAAAYRIVNRLPLDIRTFVSIDTLTGLIQRVEDTAEGLQEILGLSATGFAALGLDRTKPLKPSVDESRTASQAVTKLTQGDEQGARDLISVLPEGSAILQDTPDIDEALKIVFGNLTHRVEQALGPAVEQLNKLFASLPENLEGAMIQTSNIEAKMTGPGGTGGVVKTNASIAEMAGSLGSMGGIVRAGLGAAELLGPGGTSKIVAGAGFIQGSSPLGGFSFGGFGDDGFFGKGAMNMLSSIGSRIATGLRYDSDRIELGRFVEKRRSSGISIRDGEILLEVGANTLRIDRDDIWLNHVRLTHLVNTDDD